jgi:hypothetical protein
MSGRLATGTLASRGARNPDALAAFIAGRVLDGGRTIGLAGGASADNQGDSMTCPQCGYSGGRGDFGGDGDNDGDGSEALRTPAPSTGFVREGAPLTVRGASAGAGLSNPGGGVELAAPRYPVTGAADLLISRNPAGGASVRHRRGGSHIGDITYSDESGWQSVYGGKPGKGHAHQRPALNELVTVWNNGIGTLQREVPALSQPPVQTPLMEQYGVPAIRALATPATSASAGPRVTASSAGSDSDDDDKGSGLSGKAASVYAKLVAKGWDKAKARKFAANASRFGSSS